MVGLENLKGFEFIVKMGTTDFELTSGSSFITLRILKSFKNFLFFNGMSSRLTS